MLQSGGKAYKLFDQQLSTTIYLFPNVVFVPLVLTRYLSKIPKEISISKQHDFKHLSDVTCEDVEILYKEMEKQLHEKIDATRDAYFGFIFPINRSDLSAVSEALDLDTKVAQLIYKKSKEFSPFRVPGRKFAQLTNHIYGASILALRGKSLDTGLKAATDESIKELAVANEDVVLEIAAIRASWFGRIFFPAQAFSNAISVFGGNVSPNALLI